MTLSSPSTAQLSPFMALTTERRISGLMRPFCAQLGIFMMSDLQDNVATLHMLTHTGQHSAVSTRAPDRLVITIALLFIASLFGMSKAFPIFIPKKHALNLCRTPVVIPSRFKKISADMFWKTKCRHFNKIYFQKSMYILTFFPVKNVVFLCP